MKQWQTRVVEEANLFNPAFCATLLAKAADDFLRKGHRPIPFAFSFLILPIVLHHGTRSALPGSTVTSLLPWIRRVNRSINKETARELAAEVHDIIACVQLSYSAGPRRGSPVDEEIDVVQTFLRTVFDIWPSDDGNAANESVWLMERLTDINDELYLRYMRLCDGVNGTDFFTEWGLA